ncbi:MAG: hypothetical protein DRN27_04260 [Thermoplasmata archaeon]|nr:MAG: hypothetical protein DRN27_04260 [Thermoplasmata archaeon]
MEAIQLNDDQKDAMQEVINIGASHAATALSQMVNKEIKIGIPTIKIIPIEETVECVQYNEVIAGVFLKTNEELPTYVLMLIEFESALQLSNLLLGSKPDLYKGELDEMEQSAIKEVGNIVMSSFFDSLSELIGISMIPGPPSLAYDMPSTILEYIMLQLGEIAQEVVVFNCLINEENEKMFDINLFLMPEPETITKILTNLGMT